METCTTLHAQKPEILDLRADKGKQEVFYGMSPLKHEARGIRENEDKYKYVYGYIS